MNRTNEIWLLLLWNIPAFLLSNAYGSNYLITAAFFFVVPSIYLSIRKPEIVRKIALVSLILIIPSVVVISYLGHTDGSWYNPSVLGLRIFNSYPIDDFVWGFVYYYYILVVYEYFFERVRILTLPKKFLNFEYIGLALALFFTIYIYLRGIPITVDYFYFWVVIVLFCIVPGLVFLFHRQVFIKAIYVALFFAPLSLLYEYIANVKGNWFFPGTHFIGQVQLLNVTFLLEEFTFLFLAAPAVVACYEFIADDKR
jgi:hypothetical protein